MAANTKYQAAPQRDSFDEPSPSYTQAPPSYQAQGNYNDPMMGGPRGEDDNLPDDFKVSNPDKGSSAHDLMDAHTPLVWGFSRRGYPSHPDAVCSQSLRHLVSSQIRHP